MRWTPSITATQSRLKGGEGNNEKEGPPQYLKCVDAHVSVACLYTVTRCHRQQQQQGYHYKLNNGHYHRHNVNVKFSEIIERKPVIHQHNFLYVSDNLIIYFFMSSRAPFTARCYIRNYAQRGTATASRLSVCDVEVSWSHS